MGLNPVCLDRQTSTFLSDFDGRVFLCPHPRMLKKSASSVLASLRPSNVPQRVRLGPSLAAALLDSLFEHPA